MNIFIIKSRNLNGVLLFFLVLFNFFGVVFSNITHMPSMVFTLFPLLVLFYLFIVSKNRCLKMDNYQRCFVGVSSLIVLLHFLFCELNINEIKYYLFIVTFVFIVSNFDYRQWEFVEFAFIVCSIIISIDAIRYIRELIGSGFGLYNVRLYTMLDKPYYTHMLSLTTLCLMKDIFDGSIKGIKKYFDWLLIILFMFVGVIMIQSKIYLIITSAYMILCLYFNKHIKLKTKILVSMVSIVGFIIVLSVFPYVIPEYIFIFINKFTGLFGNFIPVTSSQSSTYDLRYLIFKNCLNIISENIFLGIGFGNYEHYAMFNQGLLSDVVETESSILNLFVEGGTIYTFAYFGLYIYILKSLYYIKRHNKQADKLFILLVAYFILNLGNDFYNCIHWLVLSFSCICINEYKCCSRW